MTVLAQPASWNWLLIVRAALLSRAHVRAMVSKLAATNAMTTVRRPIQLAEVQPHPSGAGTTSARHPSTIQSASKPRLGGDRGADLLDDQLRGRMWPVLKSFVASRHESSALARTSPDGARVRGTQRAHHSPTRTQPHAPRTRATAHQSRPVTAGLTPPGVRRPRGHPGNARQRIRIFCKEPRRPTACHTQITTTASVRMSPIRLMCFPPLLTRPLHDTSPSAGPVGRARGRRARSGCLPSRAQRAPSRTARPPAVASPARSAGPLFPDHHGEARTPHRAPWLRQPSRLRARP